MLLPQLVVKAAAITMAPTIRIEAGVMGWSERRWDAVFIDPPGALTGALERSAIGIRSARVSLSRSLERHYLTKDVSQPA
jgi:hypothetical protein